MEEGGNCLAKLVGIIFLGVLIIKLIQTIYWGIITLLNSTLAVLILLLLPSLLIVILALTIKQMKQKNFHSFQAIIVPILTAGLGLSIGFGFQLGFCEPRIIAAIAGTGIPLTTMTFYPPIKRAKLVSKYRQKEQHLIKP